MYLYQLQMFHITTNEACCQLSKYIYHDTVYLVSLCCMSNRLDEHGQLNQVPYASKKTQIKSYFI